ncbi:hypothetical protein HU200_008504 [Digitaria exilis]|uniref:RING-type domain-containing protein n=1 Tax=Digitaria exilis TaxID=1010633 RepID=A0A835KTE8_9POAL|nr:hypothetical protein HU200_008504 [Digitaria exilis]
MGFPLVCYSLAVPKPVIAFCKLLSVIRDAVLLMLAVVGLCRFPYADDGGSSSSSADAPRPEEVKARLPAVEYGHLVAERLMLAPSTTTCHDDAAVACHGGDGEEEEATASASTTTTCIVCLETVEATDEVRRLGNCAHAFHRGCIDKWIDMGRATCPLCRSDLLPRPRRWSWGGPPLGLGLGLGRLAGLLTRVR